MKFLRRVRRRIRLRVAFNIGRTNKLFDRRLHATQFYVINGRKLEVYRFLHRFPSSARRLREVQINQSFRHSSAAAARLNQSQRRRPDQRTRRVNRNSIII